MTPDVVLAVILLVAAGITWARTPRKYWPSRKDLRKLDE